MLASVVPLLSTNVEQVYTSTKSLLPHSMSLTKSPATMPYPSFTNIVSVVSSDAQVKSYVSSQSNLLSTQTKRSCKCKT